MTEICQAIQRFAENTSNPGVLRCTLAADHTGRHRTVGGVLFGHADHAAITDSELGAL